MRLAPPRNEKSHDLIMTPPELAAAIVRHFHPAGRLLDPCRGRGAFYDALCDYSDTVCWCEIGEGVDFFSWHQPVDWIITNPPWSQLRGFLRHAMTVAPNIVFLAALVHFCTKARLRDIERAGYGICEVLLCDHPPPPWPGSGFQPAAVLIRRGAPSLFGSIATPAPLLEAL